MWRVCKQQTCFLVDSANCTGRGLEKKMVCAVVLCQWQCECVRSIYWDLMYIWSKWLSHSVTPKCCPQINKYQRYGYISKMTLTFSKEQVRAKAEKSIDNPSVSITCAVCYHIRQQYDSPHSLTYYVGSHDSCKLHLSRQAPKILWHTITQTHTQQSHTLTHASLAQSYSPPTDTDRLRCSR